MIEFFETQHLIESLVTRRIVPGVNYAFIKGNQVFSSTIGFQSLLPDKTQLSPFSLYDLASLTKVLGTTNVFLELYQSGKLNFSEPLQEFLPEFKDSRIRLNHLLTHTSGIRGWIQNRDQLSAAELLKAIIGLPVTAEFEKKMRYADTNFVLLGLVLEKIYGHPVQDVITDQVIKPMGLKEMTFTPDAKECVPTALLADGKVLQGVVHDPKARILGKHCGSAGMFADLDSLIQVSKGYLGLDQDILPINQDTAASLFQIETMPGVHPRSWGWDLLFDPQDQHPLLYHTGFTGTFMVLDRLNQSAMIVLTNRIHPSGHNQVFLAMRQQIVDTFLQENIYHD